MDDEVTACLVEPSPRNDDGKILNEFAPEGTMANAIEKRVASRNCFDSSQAHSRRSRISGNPRQKSGVSPHSMRR